MNETSGPTPGVPPPAVLPAGLLSDADGRLTLVTSAGNGFSALRGEFLTAWRPDTVGDPGGLAIFLRDRENRSFASVFPHVNGTVDVQPGRFETVRTWDGIEIRTAVAIDPESATEIRTVALVNASSRARELELTSYAEIVLQDPRAHAAHPAFSRLFVQTEFDATGNAVLARRRPRSPEERHPWLVHSVLPSGSVTFETDRARFVGRGGTVRSPAALTGDSPLSGTTGNVLDPILSLRRSIVMDAGAEIRITFLLGVADDRNGALALAARFTVDAAIDAAFDRAGTLEMTRRAACGISDAEAARFQAIAAAMLSGRPELRASPEVLARAAGRIGDLARYGVATADPVAVVHAERPEGAELVPMMRKAHAYWRSLGVPIQLVILMKEDGPSQAGTSPGASSTIDLPLTLRTGDIPAAHRDLLDAIARLVVMDRLADLQADPRGGSEGKGALSPSSAPRDDRRPMPIETLTSDNTFGGFAAEEYVIHLPHGGPRPPRPWINVIANDDFGFLVSETGAGNTWHRNSREHRLTPWSNDAVVDPHGEAFYARAEDTGAFWSLLPGPAPGAWDYEMRHGFGWSRCRHAAGTLEQEVTLFVPPRDPLRVTTVRIANRGAFPRRVSLYAYYRLVLGDLAEECGRFVVTEHAGSATLFARNRTAAFPEAVTFAAVVASGAPESVHVTGDRAAFLGPGGDPARPGAVAGGGPLDGRTGAGFDACAAQQVTLTIDPDSTVELSFLLGEAENAAEARSLIERYATPETLARSFAESRASWTGVFSRLQIETPSKSLDHMVNGWLPYQTIACRIRARTAFYQSGGAFGFRDQLQDATSLTILAPEIARAQILLHAAHQFVEGDVLHWWHPPDSRGIRTRFADDLLWLPGLTAHYIRTTGDRAILDENVRYITARPLEEGEDEAFLAPSDSGTSGDLFEHCLRAIDRSLNVGAHGLPLFGTGDWNDGMNRVGREGKGESAWMGFFLHHVLGEFLDVCGFRLDAARRERYVAHRTALAAALNDTGWDGDWYRRGYYDDGTPLGSRESDECRIDALAQSWAVISGVASPERARAVMDEVEKQLISRDDGIIRLLTPPFENSSHDPGYIQGYVVGVRENGGQYTHAALWVVQAMATLGRHDQVGALLDMLNPITRTSTPEQVARYQAEPYVVAADVYGASPHVGRAGWTWYTGSSGWMYRIALESLLGFRIEGGDTIVLKPCIPLEWPGFKIRYRVPGEETRYEITVENGTPEGSMERGGRQRVVKVLVDGIPLVPVDGIARVPIERDGAVHKVTTEVISL